jgi:hypothetical protein
MDGGQLVSVDGAAGEPERAALTFEAKDQADLAARIGEQKALEALIQASAFWDEDGLPAITPESGEEIANQMFLAGYRREPEPREVTTVEELDALPLDSVILLPTPDGPIPAQLDPSGWLMAGGGYPLTSARIIERAEFVTVLFTPEVK